MTQLRHVLDWQTVDDHTWTALVNRAVYHKTHAKEWYNSAHGKSIGLLFFNPSLRTRTSMELAGAQLGAHVTTLNIGQGTWGFAWQKGVRMDGNEAEHIQEAVGVLSRYYDALGIRAFASQTNLSQDRDEVLINQFIEASSVPVVNLESAFYHPCQALGDAATLDHYFDGDVAGKKFVLTWAYHPKALPMAVPNSALLMAARQGMDVTLACPRGFELDEAILSQARTYCNNSGSRFHIANHQEEAFEDADVIYAKSWGSSLLYSDKETEVKERESFQNWCVNKPLMDMTHKAVFMHCLPVRRNVVVQDEVLDSTEAIHLNQAEFRLHAQKAILEYMWNL